jgi:UDP-glucose 4-epimerase
VIPSPPIPFGSPPAWLGSLAGRHVVVSGADGFIGSHVVHHALAAGARVTAVCAKEPWRLHEVDGPRLALVHVRSGEWWTGEFRNALESLLAEADGLVLLLYEPPPRDASNLDRLSHELSVNAAGAHRLAELAVRYGVPVVFASSAEVYGGRRENPVTEQVTPHPATPYARAKLEAERLLEEAVAANGSAFALRIATAFGPGENGPRAIPSFIRALGQGERAIVHGDGGDVRDYVHVSDIASAVVNAVELARERHVGTTVVNVGSGVGRPTLDVLRAVAAAMGRRAEPTFEPAARPPSRLVLDTSRARERLGFEARTDFDVAVAEEADWLLASLGCR